MAIKDLLWACPECGTERGLRRTWRGEVCTACGTRFRRGAGALIEAKRPGQGTIVLPPAVWLDRLPKVRLPWERAGEASALADRGCEERAEVRFCEGERSVSRGREFFGRVERMGRKHRGTLRLLSDRLIFMDEAGDERTWPLDALTAVQASSSTLQIKARREPVVSIRFPEGSARLWEERIETALRQRYRAAGRGAIVEFQPRIVTR